MYCRSDVFFQSIECFLAKKKEFSLSPMKFSTIKRRVSPLVNKRHLESLKNS